MHVHDAAVTVTEPSSVLLSGLEHLTTLLQAEVEAYRDHPYDITKGARGGSTPADPGGPRTLNDLDIILARLGQVKEWLQQDSRLLPLVDDYIGAQVRAMEQRQTRQNVGLAVATTIGEALLGWSVSLLGTPTSLLHLISH
jgi:hypothetical protein